MKFKLFTLFFIFTLGAFAQKAKVTAAYNFQRYDELDKAKEAIDEAVANAETAGFWKAWKYRGDIYYAIAKTEKEEFKGLSENPLQVAFESYKQVFKVEASKKMDENEINSALQRIYPLAFNTGIAFYNNEDYKKARGYFEICFGVNAHFGSVDTLSLYNIALTSDLSGDIEKAIEAYSQCIDYNYRGANTIAELANIYLVAERTDDAKALLKKGRKKYPRNQFLVTTELNIYLTNGEFEDALENLNIAIENDPTNPIFYYARGTIYNNQPNLEKAIEDYSKAIENDVNYFDAYYNLGALYFNQGADMINACNEIMDNKKYEACKAEADIVFQNALPPLEKAYELNPEDQNTVVSLKQVYVRTGNTEKYEQMGK